jgi:hypothetical protein
LNHGDPAASDALRLRLERELGLSVRVALEHDAFDVEPRPR